MGQLGPPVIRPGTGKSSIYDNLILFALVTDFSIRVTEDGDFQPRMTTEGMVVLVMLGFLAM